MTRCQEHEWCYVYDGHDPFIRRWCARCRYQEANDCTSNTWHGGLRCYWIYARTLLLSVVMLVGGGLLLLGMAAQELREVLERSYRRVKERYRPAA